MSSWGKKISAWLGFKQKPQKGAKDPKAVRMNVGNTEEEEIASAMLEDLERIRKRGPKNKLDYTGTLIGGGGRGLG